MQSYPLIGIDYLVEKPERGDGCDRYSRKFIIDLSRRDMREHAVFVFDMSNGIRLEIQKLMLLVTSPRGSGIYGRPEGNGQANCSSGRKRNERDRHCLYIYLRLSAPSDQRIIAVISIGLRSLAPFAGAACTLYVSYQKDALVAVFEGSKFCIIFLKKNQTRNLNSKLEI